MLRIEGKHTEQHHDPLRTHGVEGEGPLLLGALVFSWMLAIGVGWLLWRMAPI
ncbi:MAG: hypothetical protein R8F63_00100 [Acidimicrobiales bacterium]|nr:hypothetical protein [Acidimicrobiales bacterium]